jgi:hypothetical protein
MLPRTIFITSSFVVHGGGTLLMGPRLSEIKGLIAVGDEIEVCLQDAPRRSRVVGIETINIISSHPDYPVVILLTDDIGKVPSGTAVRPVP